MGTEQDIDHFLETIVQEGLTSRSKEKLQFQLDRTFGDIDFNNKSVLDIGGGFGFFSFYAACRGARSAICLDPEADGSSLELIENFQKLSRALGLSNVEHQPATIQATEFEAGAFDIILMHNSVNHLDEPACINLLEDTDSRDSYQAIFTKLFSFANSGAKLIVCDCSRYNFFALLGIRNPSDPNLEWHKHQAPEEWASLLSKAGFVNPKIDWTSPNALGNLGRLLFANKPMAYFFTSHFRLTMDTP